jgi:hypothetical protein
MVVTTTGPIAAGATDVVIRVPESAVIPELRGRVVSPGGQPLADIDIHLLVNAYLPERGQRGGGDAVRKSLGKTGADGRFLLRDVPSESQIDFTAPRVQGRGFFADRLPAGSELEVVVTRLCHFRVELEGELARARGISFSDARGQPAWTSSSSASGRGFMALRHLTGGATPVLSVSEAATTMQVHGDQGVLAEVPVRLVFGEVTVIRR